MHKLKRIFFKRVYLILVLIFSVYLTSCVKVEGSKDSLLPNLVLELTPKQFSDFLKDKFPIEKDLTLGKLILENPDVLKIDKNNKLEMKTDLLFKNPLMKIDGTVDIAGNILFNKKEKAFYLQNPEIKKVKILGKELPVQINPALNTLINTFFKQVPIYKLDKGYQKYLIKDVRVEDGKIKIVLGL